MADNEYNANSIRILTDTEIADRYLFVRAGELSKHYRGVSLDRITLGLEVAMESGAGEQYFIDRYLKRLDITEHPEFTAIYKDRIFPRNQ